MLFRSIPRRDVKPIAKDLIRRFGSFAEILAAAPARLMETDGIGESVVAELKIVEAAGRRLVKGAVGKRPVLSSWSAVSRGPRGPRELQGAAADLRPEISDLAANG